jgi:hypothetical protein
MSLSSLFADQTRYTFENRISFDYFCREKNKDFGKNFINLAMLKWRSLKTLGVARMIAYMFCHEASHLMAEMKVNEEYNDKSYVNLVHGREQLGKTEVIVTTAFFSVFLNMMPVIFVRNFGGSTSIKSIQEAYYAARKRMVARIEALDPSVEVLTKLHNATDFPFRSELENVTSRRYVLCQRMNKTQFEKIVSLIPKLFEEDTEGIMLGNKKRVFAFIKDEADEDLVSSSVDVGVTESSQFTAEKEHFSDTFVHSSGFNVFFTATPTNVLVASPGVNLSPVVISLPISENYVGFGSKCRRQVVVKTEINGVDIRPRALPKKRFASDVFDTNPQLRDIIACVANHHEFQDSPHTNFLVAIPCISSNENKKVLSKTVAGLASECLSFSSDGDDKLQVFLSEHYRTRISTDTVKLNVTSLLRKYYSLAKIPRAALMYDSAEACLTVVFSPKMRKTVNICYSVCEAIRLSLPDPPKPFFVCSSYITASRGASFKTIDHKYPVTHMYTNFNVTADCRNLVAVSQQAGRICGIDTLHSLTRYLFCSKEYKKMLDGALALHDHIDTGAVQSRRDIVNFTYEQSVMCRITKKRIAEDVMRDVSQLARQKRARGEDQARPVVAHGSARSHVSTRSHTVPTSSHAPTSSHVVPTSSHVALPRRVPDPRRAPAHLAPVQQRGAPAPPATAPLAPIQPRRAPAPLRHAPAPPATAPPRHAPATAPQLRAPSPPAPVPRPAPPTRRPFFQLTAPWRTSISWSNRY